jgi:hypothetical protein
MSSPLAKEILEADATSALQRKVGRVSGAPRLSRSAKNAWGVPSFFSTLSVLVTIIPTATNTRNRKVT